MPVEGWAFVNIVPTNTFLPKSLWQITLQHPKSSIRNPCEKKLKIKTPFIDVWQKKYKAYKQSVLLVSFKHWGICISAQVGLTTSWINEVCPIMLVSESTNFYWKNWDEMIFFKKFPLLYILDNIFWVLPPTNFLSYRYELFS